MTASPQVLLATDRAHPEGEPGHEHLDAELDRRGITSRWAVWDDPDVDWRAARVVAARCTWDYDTRLEEFLVWAESVGPALLHGAEVFGWNTDKAYLAEIGQRSALPVVPTVVADDLEQLRAAIATRLPAVVKPRHGAGGRGVVLVERAGVAVPSDGGPWVVQPLVESVRDEGETSVFVLGGRAVSQVRKVAGTHDIRVHEEYGGASAPVPLAPEAARLAVDAVTTASELVGTELAYARIDMLRHESRLVVSEIEITEPGLYLDVLPGNAAAFADVLAARL